MNLRKLNPESAELDLDPESAEGDADFKTEVEINV